MYITNVHPRGDNNGSNGYCNVLLDDGHWSDTVIPEKKGFGSNNITTATYLALSPLHIVDFKNKNNKGYTQAKQTLHTSVTNITIHKMTKIIASNKILDVTR